MLKQLFNEFKVWAKLLAEEEGIVYSAAGRDVIQQMADGYCAAKDAGNERKKNLYIAGLMLRFWYAISKLKSKSPIQGLDYPDYMGWLYEAIEYACKYRAWQKPGSKVNAQQAINQCIETIRLQKYYDLNLQKNRANVNTVSFDVSLEDDGKTTMLDTLLDEDDLVHRKFDEDSDAAYSLIQRCINKKKIVEAIILDTIAFNDVQKVTKTVVKSVDEDGNPYKYAQHSSEFWPFKCVQILSNLPDDYTSYFLSHYKVVEQEFEAALVAIKKANNQKLYKFLRRTLSDTKELLNYA